VSTDLVQIAARNYLADPDPSMAGIVQNNIALLRISSDMARGAVSLALAERRFEISVSGGLHIRPAVNVVLADRSGSIAFPEAKSADVTFTILDRRSIAGLRLSASGTLLDPIGSSVPSRSRGTIVRLSAARMFAGQRGQIEVDAMAEHMEDAGTAAACDQSTMVKTVNVLACYGTSTTTAAQIGALASWRIAREWLLIADTHLGYQEIDSKFVQMAGTTPVTWPTIRSVTAFLRAQWRYR
jgi:hypothetical protein